MYTYLYCKELLQEESIRSSLSCIGYEPKDILMMLCREQNQGRDYNPALTHKSISWMVMNLITWATSESEDFWCEFHCELEELGL